MEQFTELTLAASLQRNLARNLYQTPTPVQAQSIPAALTGVDVVATAQTGTGKTLAFLVPLVERMLQTDRRDKIQALVLAPTRELALQIAESFSKLTIDTKLRAAVVVGGLSEGAQLNAIRRGVQIVIATPGRLEDFLNRNLIDLSAVNAVVLDEADRMLDMGFLPAIEKILRVLPKQRQNLFFSATMEPAVEKLIRSNSNDPVRIAINGTSATTPDQVELHLYEIDGGLKTHLLSHILDQNDGSTLVFARTKHGADRLAKKLSAIGVKAVAMHGDRTQNQRNQALAGFRDGRYRVLVATDVAARGIHVDSVAHVVNFDLPQAPQDFIHRVGRTGRAGQQGLASTFFSRAERGEVTRIEKQCKIRLLRRELSKDLVSDWTEKAAVEHTARSFEPKAAETQHRAPRPEWVKASGPQGNQPKHAVNHRFAGKRVAAKPAKRGR